MKDVKKGVQALLDGLKTVSEEVDSLIKRCNELTQTEGSEKKAKGRPKSSPKEAKVKAT